MPHPVGGAVGVTLSRAEMKSIGEGDIISSRWLCMTCVLTLLSIDGLARHLAICLYLNNQEIDYLRLHR